MIFRTAALLPASFAIVLASPAFAGDTLDLTDPALIEAGALAFDTHCVVCHGPTAEDGDSGDIRGAEFRKVRMAVGGVDRMPEIEDVTSDEIEAITAFLADLAAQAEADDSE